MSLTEAQKKANAKWNAKNPDKVRAYARAYRARKVAKDPETVKEWERRSNESRHARDACEILTKHAEDLADDPERLSTEFITGLMGTGELEEECQD